MQTFKLICKLMKNHKGPLLIIFSVFMAISILMTTMNSSEKGDEFKATRLNIGIVDQGNGKIAKFIKDYFNDEHDLKDFSYDEKEIVNELYWKYIDYVLVIPEGADEKLLADEKNLELKCMKVPGHSVNGLFETEVEMSLSKLKALMQAGLSIEEATQKLISIKEEKVEVIMAVEKNENTHDRLSTYLMFIPYLFIAICIEGIGFILIIVNQKLLKDRVECASTSMNKRTLGIVAGILCFGAFVYSITFAVAAILSKGSMFTDLRLPYFLLNSFVLLLFSLSLGFFVGVIAKSTVSLNGYQNIFGLSLCFLGGVFVPQEVLGETALKVGRFLPTYWYVRSNETIAALVTVTDDFLKEIFMNSSVVFFYAMAVFALGLVIQAQKRKNVCA